MIAFERVPESVDPTGVIQRNLDAIAAALGVAAQVPTFIVTSGTPNGIITASPPARCFVLAGGSSATEWQKISGSATNTGWERVQTAP